MELWKATAAYHHDLLVSLLDSRLIVEANFHENDNAHKQCFGRAFAGVSSQVDKSIYLADPWLDPSERASA